MIKYVQHIYKICAFVASLTFMTYCIIFLCSSFKAFA